MNSSSESPTKYKENPFNNCSILRSLFKVGSHCSYNPGSWNFPNDIILLPLRAVSIKAYEIGTSYIIDRFGILDLEIFPIGHWLPNPESGAYPYTLSHPFSLWLNSRKNIPPSPFMIKKFILKWQIYSTPYKVSKSMYQTNVRRYGPFIKTLSISLQLIFNIVTYGLNSGIDFTCFGAVTHIYLNVEWSLSLTELRIRSMAEEFSGVENLLGHLVSALPNPQLVQTITLIGSDAMPRSCSNWNSYWSSLPKTIFNLFPSLLNLYYRGLIHLNPSNGWAFLNRDPRIQLFYCYSEMKCMLCCNCPHAFHFDEFHCGNDSHNKLFEALIKDICNLATYITLWCYASNNSTLYENYLDNVKWFKIKKCRIVYTDEVEQSDKVVNVNLKVQNNLCFCVKI